MEDNQELQMNLYKTTHWKRGWLESLLKYLRDIFIAGLPIRRLPRFLRIILLGRDLDFVFLVHPRRKEDVFIAWPFAKFLRSLLGKRFYTYLRYLPPTILDIVEGPDGISGAIVSSTWLPEALIHNRKQALQEMRKCLRFITKISRKNAYVGLGEWWPFLTKRGTAAQNYAQKLGLQITSGYSGTLCSILLSVYEAVRISNVGIGQLRVLILGVGKMGSSVAHALVSKVGSITIFDKNKQKQINLENALISGQPISGSYGCRIIMLSNEKSLSAAMAEHDMCIITTSNLRRILRTEDLLEKTLVLDDARPEAIPRLYDKARKILVLEGGLLRINNLRMTYDFGFGNDGSVFGCLAEAYLLACDKGRSLTPTLGELDFDNFWLMFSKLDYFGITSAGFKSGHISVDDIDVANLIQGKHSLDPSPLKPNSSRIIT